MPHCFSTDSKQVTLIDFESWFCVKLCFAPACLELWSVAAFETWLVFLILVVNVVGELQRKRTLAASRGFLAAARLSCYYTETYVFSYIFVWHKSYVKEYALYSCLFRNSKPTTCIRREYQGISLASSPTSHTPPPLLYELSHYPSFTATSQCYFSSASHSCNWNLYCKKHG